LRPKEGRACGIKDVHAHVVGVRPDAQLGIIKEVRAEVKAVAIPSASGIARGRNCDAFVSRNAGSGKLTDDPAVSELVVEHDRIAIASGLANAAEP